MKTFFFASILLIMWNISKSQNPDSLARANDLNPVFAPGEHLRYKIKIGFVKAGEARMSVNLVPEGYSYVYHAVAKAYSGGVAGAFYSLTDIYESYMNVQNGYPIKAVRNIKEGNYNHYDEILFLRSENKIRSTNKGERVVPPNLLDLLSAFYYARRFKFPKVKQGEVIAMNTYFDDKLFHFKIKLIDRETLRTPVGKVKCMHFEPVLEGEFKKTFEDENDLRIWVSDDGNYIPVKIRLSLPVGAVKCELVEYSGLKNAFTALED